MPRVVASVPGKLILMGEHAAVYGCPALVAAIGLRARIELTTAGEGVTIELSDLGCQTSVEWSEILDVTRRARREWRQYAAGPKAGGFRPFGGEDPARLVKIALGEVAEACGVDRMPALKVRVASELPSGSGFGSSAAVAVGVIAALLALLGSEPGADRIERLALEVERRQHGLPSGVDHRTVLQGGVLWAQRTAEGRVDTEELGRRSPLLSEVRVYQTGQPAESTGAVVAAVREKQGVNEEAFRALLERMERGVRAFRQQLLSTEPERGRSRELVLDYQACLEELGVVPAAVRRAIREVEAGGGAAKISGAGALSGSAAGCLLVYPGEDDLDEPVAALAAYPRLPSELGADGLRLERDG